MAFETDTANCSYNHQPITKHYEKLHVYRACETLPCVFFLDARSRGALPCSVFTAHGEKDARQKNILLCGFSLVHGKHFFTPPDGTPFDNRQLFIPFVVHQKGARQRHTLCRCLPCVSRRRTTNIYLCRVFSYGARQNIYKNFDFCTSFYFSTTKILFVLYYNM
jgi:hypothetical protein